MNFRTWFSYNIFNTLTQIQIRLKIQPIEDNSSKKLTPKSPKNSLMHVPVLNFWIENFQCKNCLKKNLQSTNVKILLILYNEGLKLFWSQLTSKQHSYRMATSFGF
jgi:hypothetical protein